MSKELILNYIKMISEELKSNDLDFEGIIWKHNGEIKIVLADNREIDFLYNLNNGSYGYRYGKIIYNNIESLVKDNFLNQN